MESRSNRQQNPNLPTTFEGAKALAVAFLRQCEPAMEKYRDREALKAEIDRMRGGTGGLKGAMKNTGVIRKIDDLGRVVIPKELRRTLDISDDDPMEIFFDDETAAIFIQKFNMKRCVFCDSHVDVSEFMNKHICESCISQLFETED